MNLNPHLSHDKTHKLARTHTRVGFSCFMGTFYSRIGSYTVLYKHLNRTFTESFLPCLDFEKTSLSMLYKLFSLWVSKDHMTTRTHTTYCLSEGWSFGALEARWIEEMSDGFKRDPIGWVSLNKINTFEPQTSETSDFN